MAFEATIGLEVHVQLATKSKIFSGAAIAYGREPNSQACAVDLGLPGTLPVLNREAVNMAIKFALAIDAKMNTASVFARKNYFYPDLPKGYQISQYETPIVGEGTLPVLLPDGTIHSIAIERAHLEEDAGKSLHAEFHGMSGIDLNRAGTPLLEVVSKPVMHSSDEAVAYLKALHSLVRYLGICDGNMQEGSFRADVNVSVRPNGQTALGTRTECKNLNSFRFIERAINYEIERQIAVIEMGEEVIQETRLYDPDRNETRSMRSKEDAPDYRYFPDPDLLPVIIYEKQVEAIKATLPELPLDKRRRFIEILQLNADDASQLVQNPAVAAYFEVVIAKINEPKLAANWITTEVTAYLKKNDMNINELPVKAETLAILLKRITDNTLSNHAAKTVFTALCHGKTDVDAIIKEQGLKQMNDTGALITIINEVIQAHPQQVAELKAGKDKLFGFLIGQVMKRSQGKANPKEVTELLKARLKQE